MPRYNQKLAALANDASQTETRIELFRVAVARLSRPARPLARDDNQRWSDTWQAKGQNWFAVRKPTKP